MSTKFLQPGVQFSAQTALTGMVLIARENKVKNKDYTIDLQ